MAFAHLVTERLLLRPVMAEDLDVVVALGADARVMAWFGGPVAAEKGAAWMKKQLEHWRQHGFGRMAVIRDGVVVGFVGLTRTDFDAGFTPAIEIAWRLAFDHWGMGYATEAARAVLRDGFDRLGLDEIVGVTTPGNLRSRRVMERLGMVPSPGDTFEHPLVPEGDPLRLHVVYRLTREANSAIS
jgi:RimJ/RimL family protein N-acetyltransferase